MILGCVRCLASLRGLISMIFYNYTLGALLYSCSLIWLPFVGFGYLLIIVISFSVHPCIFKFFSIKFVLKNSFCQISCIR